MDLVNTKILSDFEDCYDKHLLSKSNGIILDRRDKTINRSQIFKFLRESNILTMETKPVFRQEANTDIVVYEGHKAIKLNSTEASVMYRNNLSTQYIKHEKVISFRRIQIGNYKFIIKYTNEHSWKSRDEGVQVSLLDYCEQSLNDHIDLPLYYIEYIVHDRQYKAIDMGINQIINGTGIEKIIPPKEIANIIALACMRKEQKEVKNIWE